ncbi:TonB-dependent siderophore receptor [Pseudolysobacter antarcticus]|uniref:TonB-dependent siderophore receptor n=1 Tax=Pseudolysobacter antarcticus TaxID=2511995 RepID=A0A411HH10_9GAMM|nr:TonB-dependent siderophore receptor [Pseudolysobacter antarcticus]QBB69761.1 TonB-dependent siderophore receptor [Pseudolysobacter antarcticus]
MSSSPFITSSHARPKRLLATALGVAFVSSASSVLAADNGTPVSPDADPAAGAVEHLDTINVDGIYSQKPASPKYTEVLRDVPQTINVIPKDLIQDQGVFLLRDILRQNVAGITFGAGEGGSYGDSVNIRGFSATNDISIDGIRDSANTTHSDPFNIDQIEVVKGPSSVYSGAGTVGGTINLVSKIPQVTDFTNISIGAGNADYRRVTADINQQVGGPHSGMAFRLNVMAHENDVAERDITGYKRWGIAPSFILGLGTPTQLTLSYVHEHDKNRPEYGIPLRNYAPVPGIDRSTYFGYTNVDQEKIDNDSFTAIIDHAFNEKVTLRNLTRWAQVDRYSVTDAPEGRICLKPGDYPLGTNLQLPGTAVRCGANGPASVGEGVGGPTYTPGGPIGNLRDTRNTILVNQTDLTSKFNTAGLEHTLVTGISLSHETFTLGSGSLYRNADGTTYAQLPISLFDPTHIYTLPLNRFYSTRADSTVDNRAVYAFDTLKFNDRWQLAGGLRYEHNEATYSSYTASPVASPTQVPGPLLPVATNPLKNSDDLISWRAGVVYKPQENGSIYLAYGNSKTPSTATVDGSCATSCDVDPESAKSYELGTKWDFFKDRLSLTAAIFRTDRTNYKVASGDPAIPYQTLDGSSRLKGIELGITGKISENWSVFANYDHLQSKVLQSVSAKVLATTGIDAQAGNPLANTPDNSANLWTTYALPYNVTVGYGANYTSSVFATANSYTPTTIYARAKIPGFVVHNAMLAYKVNDHLDLLLNINNIFNKEYFTQLRSVSTTSGWANPGTGRTVSLNANLKF